jgi:predicted amidohydrolase
MVNQVGANSDLIFEGGSLVVNGNGEIFDRVTWFEGRPAGI